MNLNKLLHSRPAAFIALFIAAAGRLLYCGPRYFPQLDDYIQLHNYATSSDYGALIEQEGLLASRPLAGVSDLYVWSRFWGVLIAAVLILSAMWAASALLFGGVFKRYFGGMFGRYFGASPLFAVIYTLLPLNIEGTYWLAASTRVVCGMFFSALALWIFVRFLETKKARLCVLWLIVQLISFCWYEQTLVLSLAATLLIALLGFIGGEKRSLYALLSFVNVFIYFAFTSAFSGGTLSGRMEIILPVSRWYFTVFFPEIARQIGAAFIKGGALTLFRGFIRGFKLMLADKAVLYALFALIAAAGAFMFALAHKGSGNGGEGNAQLAVGKGKLALFVKTPAAGLLFAFLLALAPVTPYFIIGNPWFSLRATVPSMAGLALFADILLGLLFSRRKYVLPAVAAVFTLTAVIASASEINDYRLTYESDQTVTAAILSESLGSDAGRVGILGLEPSFLTEQNYFYHEHIHGVTENAWGLYGAAVAVAHDMTGGVKVPDITPLAEKGFCYYVGWNRETKRLGGFDTLYRWDSDTQTLIRVYAEGSDADGWTVSDADGRFYARVWEEEGVGYIEKSEE